MYKIVRVCKFQSHNGAIAATMAGCQSGDASTGFNPTMVRLLPQKTGTAGGGGGGFQSHNGAIAAPILNDIVGALY